MFDVAGWGDQEIARSHTKSLIWHFVGLFSHIAIQALERDDKIS